MPESYSRGHQFFYGSQCTELYWRRGYYSELRLWRSHRLSQRNSTRLYAVRRVSSGHDTLLTKFRTTQTISVESSTPIGLPLATRRPVVVATGGRTRPATRVFATGEGARRVGPWSVTRLPSGSGPTVPVAPARAPRRASGRRAHGSFGACVGRPTVGTTSVGPIAIRDAPSAHGSPLGVRRHAPAREAIGLGTWSARTGPSCPTGRASGRPTSGIAAARAITGLTNRLKRRRVGNDLGKTSLVN